LYYFSPIAEKMLKEAKARVQTPKPKNDR